jgi:hypothetical protein
MECTVFAVPLKNHQNPLRQILSLEPEGRARLGKLGDLFQADSQFTRFIVPAVCVLWYLCGGDTENPLKDVAL